MLSVPYELDKTRNVRFDVLTTIRVEKALKQPILGLDLSRIEIEKLVTMARIGMQHEDNSLTDEKLMELISEHSDLNGLLEVISDALTNAFDRKNKSREAVTPE